MYATKRTMGFTLIELIVVIVLISILAMLGIGLLSKTQDYSPRFVMDQWLTQIRMAQRLAFAKQNTGTLLQFVVSQNANEWTMSINLDAQVIESYRVERDNVSVRSSTVDFVSACEDIPLLVFPHRFYFNGYGDAVDATDVQLATNTRLCFSGNFDLELCMSPSGYAYAGSCQP
ncbi:MAG: type II secretion system protein [Bermanella sp.]